MNRYSRSQHRYFIEFGEVFLIIGVMGDALAFMLFPKKLRFQTFASRSKNL